MITVFATLIACKKDEEETITPAEQSLVDDENLIEYMKTHELKDFHVGEMKDNIDWVIEEIAEDAPEGTVTLYDVMSENVIEVVENDVVYKMYYFNINPTAEGGTPAEKDSVFVDYKLFSLYNAQYDSSPLFNPTIFQLDKVILGWQLGMQKINRGIKSDPFPANYDVDPYRENIENPGKAIFLIPSGLAYGTNSAGSIPPNQVLRFDIVLYDYITYVEEE